jgi:hypothetical protein
VVVPFKGQAPRAPSINVSTNPEGEKAHAAKGDEWEKQRRSIMQQDEYPTLVLRNLDGLQLGSGYEEQGVLAEGGGTETLYSVRIRVGDEAGLQLAFSTRDDALALCAALIQVIAADKAGL